MGAMFIGQQFLQNVLGYSTLDAGLAILPAAVVHGARRAALGEAGRGARRALHAAHRLRVLPARLPHDAAAVEGGHRLLEGRARLRVRRHRRRVRRHARLALAHRVGAGAARRDGVGHRRPPARPRRRDHAVDPRRAAHRRLRRRGRDAQIAGVAATKPDHRQRRRTSSTKSFSSAADTAQQLPAVRSGADHRRREDRRSSQGDQWAYIAGIVAILLGARARLLHVPEAGDEEQRLLAEYPAEDADPPGRPTRWKHPSPRPSPRA